MVGVEFRADLVTLCNGIAEKAGFTSLSFVQNTIADYDCAKATVVIALHACDTATDDALYKAIKANAALVVVAPCCHKQIRQQMAQAKGAPDLAFLTRHGTYMEKQAEMVTDGMRAQLLEISGYQTKLFEFIGGEHTPEKCDDRGDAFPATGRHRRRSRRRNSISVLGIIIWSDCWDWNNAYYKFPFVIPAKIYPHTPSLRARSEAPEPI